MIVPEICITFIALQKLYLFFKRDFKASDSPFGAFSKKQTNQIMFLCADCVVSLT